MTRGQKWVIEGCAEVRFEDSGQACITSIYNDADPDEDPDHGIWVQVKSWHEGGQRNDHETAGLEGALIRVTVEVMT